MPLLLDQDHIAQLADMTQCMQFVENSLRSLALEQSFAQPHVRVQTPVGDDTTYWSNIMSGGDTSLDTFAIRINSALNQDVEVGGTKRSQFLGQRSHGLILTYSLSSGELLCIFPDFDISGLRVGATQGLGSKYLAKKDANSVAVLGSGKLARTSLEAVALVRKLTSVRVYSPNAAHRDDFARQMEALLPCSVQPVELAEHAVTGCDIVIAATNSNEPVLKGEWLAPGMQINSVMGGHVADKENQPVVTRMELDLKCYERSDRVVQTSVKHADFPIEGWGDMGFAIQQGAVQIDQLQGLDEILAGKQPARQSEEEIILFKGISNAVQFAAVGAWLYQAARDQGLGEEISDRWFSTDLRKWTERGFMPSP